MLINCTRNKSVLCVATLALVVFSFFQLRADAQSSGRPDETIVIGQTALVGLARGDLLRFTAFNPLKTESGRPNEPISLQLKLYDAHGHVIAESPQVEIPPGEFRSIDFNRDELPVPGEPGTGRAQVLYNVRYVLRDRNIFAATSLEIVDSSTGRTTVLSSEPKLKHIGGFWQEPL
jgi:hypothetical protein